MKSLTLINRIYSRSVRLPFGWRMRRFLSHAINTCTLRYKRVSGQSQVLMDLEEKGYAVIGHLTDTNLHYLSSLVRNNIGSESEDESNQNLKAGIFYAEESSIVRDTVFRKIIKEHNINVIADQYLKVKSKVIGCAAWLTSPTEHKLPVNAQNFHRDIDSIRWLKFFIYLKHIKI